MENINFNQNKQETREDKIKILESLIREKFERFMSPAVAGRFGDNHFSFDAASYYTLTEGDDGKVKPVKLGWGEMSEQTFLSPKDKLIYPETNGLIREIPLPMYCLSQSNSYFADESKIKQMQEDVISYFKEKAIFIFDKDGFGFVGNEKIDNSNFKKHLNLDNLPVVKIDEAISRMKDWEPTQKS